MGILGTATALLEKGRDDGMRLIKNLLQDDRGQDLAEKAPDQYVAGQRHRE